MDPYDGRLQMVDWPPGAHIATIAKRAQNSLKTGSKQAVLACFDPVLDPFWRV